jgi:uncharacterized ferredoxin-like protein
MAAIVTTATRTAIAGAAIGQHVLVKLTSDVLSVAALGEEPIGTMEEASFASGDIRAVRLRSAQGTIKCKASGAFSQGAVVYGRASGLVDDITTSAIRIGIALESATAANDFIEVLCC